MHKASIRQWETGAFEPDVRFYPAILGFLGYDPPTTFGERIAWTRIRDGLSQDDLALQLHLDPTTVSDWERGEVRRPYPRLRRLFEEYVGA